MIALCLALLFCTELVCAGPIQFDIQSNSPVSTGTTKGLILNNNYFVTNVTIGTPPQTFTLIVDTYSGTTFIPDSSCRTNAANFCGSINPAGPCFGKNIFNSSASSTYVMNGQQFVTYNNYGQTKGVLGTDTLRLSTDPTQAIIVTSDTFGQAGLLPEVVLCTPGVDGVLGLGLQANAVLGILPPVVQAYYDGTLATSVFSIYLENQGELADKGTSGTVYYGGYDTTHCQRARPPFALTSATSYQFTITNYNADTTNATYSYNVKNLAIVATSLNIINLPELVFVRTLYLLNMSSNGVHPIQVNCDAKIRLDFGTASAGVFSVFEDNLIYKAKDGTCVLALGISNFDPSIGAAPYELGTPFLRGRCSNFDPINRKISFSDPA